MTNSIPEIEDCDLMFVIGSNTTEAHPVIAMAMKRALHKGCKLIVADPRAIWLTHHADMHIAHKPGTDVWLINAMAYVVLTEGLQDKAYIAEKCENFEAFRDTVLQFPPEEAEKICGVPAEQIRQAARMYATTKKAGIFYTLGITEHTHGVDNVFTLANLVAITGHLGVRSAGLNPLRGQNNVQGAGDMGAHPDNMPGVQKVADPEARKKYEAVWGVPIPTEKGLNLTEIMHGVEHGTVRGMFCMGEDILVSEPNAGKLEKALNDIEFLVVQEIFPSETMRFADVVLPAGCFAEKDGTFTNTDRRVQRVRKAVQPPGQARADWEILCDLIRACGHPLPNYRTPGDIFAEMAGQSPRFMGMSHERLDRDGGIQWPCWDEQHPGTPTLHVDKPMRGKVLLQAVRYKPPVEPTCDDYPLVLSTGRVLYHYNAANQTTREKGAVLKVPNQFIEMHRFDAKKLGVKTGERVRVESRRGALEVEVLVSPRMQPGIVWMPLHNFGGDEGRDSRANLLTIDKADPLTGTPEYKVCAVRVTKVGAQATVAA